MAGVTIPDMRPWGRHPLTIPPNSRSAWIRLAIWELWMGMLVCATLGLGASLIVTSPGRIVAVADLTDCYAPPPVALPCERTVYRGGALDAAFTSLCGLMLIGVAVWFLWELWSAVEPKPITDDFLRLLHDSFSHDWRNPRTWPWARVFWAYGFTVVGVTLTAGVGLMLWMFVVPPVSNRSPTAKVETSQSFAISK
jgi:hypothetical protein